MRRFVLKLSLALFGVVLALLVGECVVRVAGLDPEVVRVEKGRYRLSSNPVIGYEPIPAFDYAGQSLHFVDYRGASNRLGYRDRDHEIDKPPGTFRIVVIGDSIAAGHFIGRYEDTFPARLEVALRERGVPAEVLNFGVSGYNTRQEVETLRVRALQFDPDLVLLSYCLNDRERNDGNILATLIKEAQAGGSRPPEAHLLARSALFRVIYYRLLGKGRFDALEGDTVAGSLQQLGALMREHGFAVLISIFPDFSMLDDYQREEEHAFVQRIADAQGFAVLDLRDAFRSCSGKLSHDRYHPTAAGHACAAGAMAARIAELEGQ